MITEGDSGMFLRDPLPVISLGAAAVAVEYKNLSVVGVVIDKALKESTLADAARSRPLWKDGDFGMPP